MREDETEGKTEHGLGNGECRQNYSSFDIFNVTSTHPFDKKGVSSAQGGKQWILPELVTDLRARGEYTRQLEKVISMCSHACIHGCKKE